MALPVGQISLSQVNAELNLSPTALITMNDAAVRTLAGVGGSGTVISMSNLQGKSNRVAIPLTISGPAYNYDVFTNRGPTYSPGTSDITVTINPGVTVGSTSTGTFAFLVPSAFNAGDTVTVVNNGVIQGMGGAGGAGGANAATAGPGGSGSIGGTALSIARPTTITNNGTVAGGGGGGGGGGGITGSDFATIGGGGGGGGAGFNGGAGGSGGPASGAFHPSPRPGSAGSSGTSPAGGSGGSAGSSVGPFNGTTLIGGPGGAGGGRGAGGSSGNGASVSGPTAPIDGPITSGSVGGGGTAGAYISGAPFVTWPVTGSRLGPSS